MKKHQKGSTLMIVLLLVVTMIAVAALMTLNQRAAVSRTEQLDHYQQFQHDISSTTHWVHLHLNRTLRGQPLTSRDQPWRLDTGRIPLGDATLTGKIVDMRQCYNINALHSLVEDEQGKWPDEVKHLVDLMVLQGVKRPIAHQLTARIWDFIDIDTIAHHDGAEDAAYLAKKTPYLSANHLLIDLSELRVIDGMTQALYQKISPYLCTLPDTELSLNINTLTKSHNQLLQVFSNNKLHTTTINQWLERRPLGGWQSIEKALASPAFASLTDEDKAQLARYLRVNSDYFRFEGMLKTDRISYRWQTLWHWQDPTATPILTRQIL